MVAGMRLRIERSQLHGVDVFLSGTRKSKGRLSNEVLDRGQDILMENAYRYTPKGKTQKLVTGWQRGGSGKNRTIFNRVPYFRSVDEGTKPHLILPKTKQALSFQGATGRVTTLFVWHPGSKARNFLQTIYNASKRRIYRLFDEHINRWLTSR